MTQPFDDASRPRAGPRSDLPSTALGRHNQQALVAIHGHLRQEMAQVVAAVAAVAAGRLELGVARAAVNDLAMRRNYQLLGSFCAQYCQVVNLHHTIEDRRMFTDLNRAEPDLQPVLARLEAEHGVIHQMLVAVDGVLLRLAADSAGLDDLAVEVNRLQDALLSHLDYEEGELLDPLGRMSSPI